jgi:hypothetical protein
VRIDQFLKGEVAHEKKPTFEWAGRP